MGRKLEDYIPLIKDAKEIRTLLPVVLEGTSASLTVGGSLSVTGVLDGSTAGLRTKQSVANVTEAAPTDAQLDSAFGTPAALGRGFIATVDDNDGSTASVLVWTTDTAWFHVVGVLSS